MDHGEPLASDWVESRDWCDADRGSPVGWVAAPEDGDAGCWGDDGETPDGWVRDSWLSGSVGQPTDIPADVEAGKPGWVVEFGPDGIRRRRADGTGGWERYEPEPDPAGSTEAWRPLDGPVSEQEAWWRANGARWTWDLSAEPGEWADEPTPRKERIEPVEGPSRSYTDGHEVISASWRITPDGDGPAASWAEEFRKSGWREKGLGHVTPPEVSRARFALIGAARRAGWSRCEQCTGPVPPRLAGDEPAVHPSCRRKAERRRAADAIHGARVVAADLARGQLTPIARVVVGDVATAVVGPFWDAAASIRRTADRVPSPTDVAFYVREATRVSARTAWRIWHEPREP